MTDNNAEPGSPDRSPPAHRTIERAATANGSVSTPTHIADSDSGAHPGIVLRPGPTGPRAALVDGPDIWEVIAAVRARHDEDPTRHGEALRDELCTVTGLTTAQVAAALDYYTAHPEDVDTRIAANDDAAAAAERAQRPPTGDGSPTRNNAT